MGAIGERMDITWNLMPLILWVKIENYAIPLAATATVLRLFIKAFIKKEPIRGGRYGYTSSRNGRSAVNAVELISHPRSEWVPEQESGKRNNKDDVSDVSSRSLHGSEADLVDHNGIHVKYEYEVRVESQVIKGQSVQSRSTVSAERGLP